MNEILPIKHLERYNEAIMAKIRMLESHVEGMDRSLQNLQGDVERLNSSCTAGSYCILANGECPQGFSRSTGGISTIRVWSCTGNVSPATLGDSYIRHHRQCENGDYSEILIVTCCK